MPAPAKVIAYTPWSKGGGGEYPVRLVILKWNRGTSSHEYSRHMQVKDGIHKDYFIYGHYHSTYDDAMHDLMKSVLENNHDYSPKNVSYIPPGVKQVGK